MDSTFCDLGIAIHKEACTRYLLTNKFPALLHHLPGRSFEDAMYWRFLDLEWASAEQALTQFFHQLSEESHVNIYVLQPGQVQVPLYTKECFGAVWVGDSNDEHQSWGDPGEYQLRYSRQISVPCF